MIVCRNAVKLRLIGGVFTFAMGSV